MLPASKALAPALGMDDMFRSATNKAAALFLLFAVLAPATVARAQSSQNIQLPSAPLLTDEQQRLNQCNGAVRALGPAVLGVSCTPLL